MDGESAPEERQPAEGQPEEPAALKLALSASVQDAIRELPSLMRAKMENDVAVAKIQMEYHAAATGRAMQWILVATVVLAAIVVLPASYLTYVGKLSPDAATFLFGAIVGAAFTFLRDFFPRSG